MNDRALPAWLTEALPDPPGAAIARIGQLRAGDIYRLKLAAAPPEASESRLVLVLEVDPARAIASVMLTHTDYDIRTSLDVLVTRDELGLPFDLVMETDLVGPVGTSSLADGALAHLEGPLLAALREAADGGDIPVSFRGRLGMPLRGNADARWEWKLNESAVLDRLIAAFPVLEVESVHPWAALVAALRATGVCASRQQDDLGVVTECLLAYVARRESPPAPVLALLATVDLGNDMRRAFGPMLLVA